MLSDRHLCANPSQRATPEHQIIHSFAFCHVSDCSPRSWFKLCVLFSLGISGTHIALMPLHQRLLAEEDSSGIRSRQARVKHEWLCLALVCFVGLALSCHPTFSLHPKEEVPDAESLDVNLAAILQENHPCARLQGQYRDETNSVNEIDLEQDGCRVSFQYQEAFYTGFINKNTLHVNDQSWSEGEIFSTFIAFDDNGEWLLNYADISGQYTDSRGAALTVVQNGDQFSTTYDDPFSESAAGTWQALLGSVSERDVTLYRPHGASDSGTVGLDGVVHFEKDGVDWNLGWCDSFTGGTCFVSACDSRRGARCQRHPWVPTFWCRCPPSTCSNGQGICEPNAGAYFPRLVSRCIP